VGTYKAEGHILPDNGKFRPNIDASSLFCSSDSESEILRMVSSGMLRRVAVVRIDVSEELSASFIRVTRISELGTTLAVTSNQR
jgi:hypothetical protein